MNGLTIPQTKTTNEFERAIRLVARFLADPDFFGGDTSRIETRIDSAADPLLAAAWATIRTGAALERHDPIAHYIETMIRPEIPYRLLRKLRRGGRDQDQETGGAALANNIWPDNEVVMLAAVSHFLGDLPEEPIGRRTCGGRGVTNLYSDGSAYAGGVNFRNIRGYMGSKGYMPPCPHCIHETTIEKIGQIERAVNHYQIFDMIGYTAVSESVAKRIADRVRQRNRRRMDQEPEQRKPAQNLVKIPQDDGRVILIHDIPDQHQIAFPRDRRDLYALIEGWITGAADGRRGWRGLKSWGPVIDSAGDSAADQDQESGGRNQDQAAGQKKLEVQIMVENRGKFYLFLEGYLDRDTAITEKGVKIPKLDMSHFLMALSDAGLNYAVTKGNVTLKALPDLGECLMCDNGPEPEPETAEKPAQMALLDGQK